MALGGQLTNARPIYLPNIQKISEKSLPGNYMIARTTLTEFRLA